MKKYNIKLHPIVLSELENIGQQILKVSQSKLITSNYMNYIYDQIQSLQYFPERYVIITTRNQVLKIRKFNVKKYSIFYYVLNNEVWIIDILVSSSKHASYYK